MARTQKLLVDLIIPSASTRPQLHNACPISQKWFMLHYFLVQANVIDLRVTPISPNFPPPGYERLRLNRRLPVLLLTCWWNPGLETSMTSITRDSMFPGLLEQDPLVVCETEDERDEWIERLCIPGFTSNNPLHRHVYDVGHGFRRLLLTGKTEPAMESLKRIESTLIKLGTRFLNGSYPGYTDCAMAAKLQHLRVAGAFFRGFHIPSDLENLWKYLVSIYHLEAFNVSCPSDKEILLYHTERVLRNNELEQTMQRKRIMSTLSDTFRLLDFPSNVKFQSPVPKMRTIHWYPNNDSSKKEVTSSNSPQSPVLKRFETTVNLNKCETTPKSENITKQNKEKSSTSMQFTERHDYMYRQIPPERYFAMIEKKSMNK